MEEGVREMSKYDEGFDAGYDKAQYKARNDALEEAAKVCDRLRNKNYSSEEWVAGTDDCAAAIRAMGRGSS